MNIVCLEPYFTELVTSFGLSKRIRGITHECTVPETDGEIRVVTKKSLSGPVPPPLAGAIRAQLPPVADFLSRFDVDLAVIKELKPSIILTSLPIFDKTGEAAKSASLQLEKYLGYPVKVLSYTPVTFDQVLEMFQTLASDLGVKEKGVDVAQRVKAQLMSWCDSFYDRMKNKRVTFIAGLDPLVLAGCWIPDLIQLASAQSQTRGKADPEYPKVSWEEIVEFRPDVIIISPRGASTEESLATFQKLEKLPGWEELPAVKRGEVIFAEGETLFHRPGPSLIPSMAVLVSAIAGFESGYITPRESFFRLRWLELQRHRL